MNILTAVKTLASVRKLFEAASLDLDAMLASGDDTALAAALAAAQPPAPAPLTAATPEVAALIKAAADPLAAQVSTLTAQLAAVTAAGVKIEAAATPAQVTQAINDRVMIAAQEQLARRGLAKFPGSAPSADPTTPPPSGAAVTGLARVRAHFEKKRAA